MPILWIVIAGAVTICHWISDAQPPTMFGGARWLRSLSVAVIVIGLWIRWTAIFTLGRAFSANVAIQHSQKVYKTGLYRFVRHPSYLGLLLIFLAIGLHSRNWIGLTVMMVPTAGALWYRIHIEEAILTQAFGDEYRTYIRATKRLIPRIY